MKLTKSLGACLLPLLLVLPLAAQTPPASGETAAEPPAEKSSEVTVLSKFEVNRSRDVGYFAAETTAGTRASMPITDVPGSVTVINSQLLQDLNVTDADQALKYGVSGVTSNEHTRDDLTIRGFRQQMIFRDGIQSTSFIINQLYDVERLEVVKGPAAMVFGNTGVLGGAVNYVARKPTYTPQADLTVTAGTESNYVRGTLNASGPLSENHKDIRYRVTVGGQNDDMTKNIEHNNQLFFGGAVDIDIGKTTVSLYGYYADLDRYVYFDDFLDATVTSGVMQLNKNSTETFSPASTDQNLYFDSKELYLTASAVTQLTDNFSFKGFYRYRSEDEPRRIIRGISVQADNVTLNRQVLNYPYYENGHTAQLDFLYKLLLGPVSQDISFGGDYARTNVHEQLAIYSITPLNTDTLDYSADASLLEDYPMNNTDSRTTSESMSFYVQDYVSLLDGKINLVGGLRWVDPKQTQENLLTNTSSVRDDPMKSVHRYGIVVKPLEKLSLYAMQANTFQINTGVNHLGEALKNSDGEIKEVGFKIFDLSLGGGELFFSGSYFDMKLTNVRTIGPLVVVNGQTVNEILQSAADTSKGVEADLGYRHPFGPGAFESIFTLYTADSKSATGYDTVRAPKHVSSFFLKYTFDSGSLKGLSAGFGGYYEGRKPATTTNTLYYDFADTYDVFASYRLNKHWLFSLNIDNLTDERYVASYAAVGLVGSNDGRTIRFTTKYSW